MTKRGETDCHAPTTLAMTRGMRGMIACGDGILQIPRTPNGRPYERGAYRRKILICNKNFKAVIIAIRCGICYSILD